MTTFGITMVRDEADIIGYTVRHMLTQVDRVIVADNLSSDGTSEILAELKAEHPDQIGLRRDDEVAYYQSRKMTALAARAAAMGADWVVPFDADEFWYSPHGRVADVLAGVGEAVVPVPLYNHLATALDSDAANPFERMTWRIKEVGALAKVACRATLPVTIAQGNHSACYASTGESTDRGLLVVGHFPYRSAEQLIRKVRTGAAAYAVSDLPEHEGEHWRHQDRLTDEQLEGVFHDWWWSDDPERDPKGLIRDPVLECLPTPV